MGGLFVARHKKVDAVAVTVCSISCDCAALFLLSIWTWLASMYSSEDEDLARFDCTCLIPLYKKTHSFQVQLP